MSQPELNIPPSGKPEINDFKLRIAAERKAEAEALEKQQLQEAILRGEIEKKTNKPKKEKKPRKKRVKKVKKAPISLTINSFPIVIKKRKLPVYTHQVEVNEFNKFKVDYIRKQIHHCKDKDRKAIYENALNKYDLTNYHKLN